MTMGFRQSFPERPVNEHMKKKWFIITAGLAVLAGLAVVGSGIYDRFVLYPQAEPLVATVWPVAHDIRSFIEKNGRRPQDLEDLRLGCRQTTDYAPLAGHEHIFHTDGDTVLTVRVNRRYGFVVDDGCRPWWIRDGKRF